jgi:alcohol dehydrogenase
MVGAVHAIGHALGAVAHVHHGTAMAILLPYVMEENLPEINELYAELLLPLAGSEIFALTPKQLRAQKAIETIRNLNKQLNLLTGMPINLSQAGVSKDQFELIAQKAINDGAMSTNPITFDKQTVIKILEKAF